MSKNKTAIITGAAGFVGANLARKLLENNFKVYALISKNSNVWRLKNIKKNLYVNYENLSNVGSLKKTVKKIKPDFIFHLAAHGSYPYQENTLQMINTNIIGTYNLLEATKDVNYKCFINTGSSSEYGLKNNPMKEIDNLEPSSFYAATKASSTLLCNVFAKSFNKPIVTFRLFSVYGPFEEKTRLIPTVIKSALTKKTLQLTKAGIKHDFIYVDDVTSAYLSATRVNIKNGEILNIGTGKQIDNTKIAKIVKKIEPSLKIKIGSFSQRSWDTTFWVANITKSKKILHWEPKYSVEEGLMKTYDWFKHNLSDYIN